MNEYTFTKKARQLREVHWSLNTRQIMGSSVSCRHHVIKVYVSVRPCLLGDQSDFYGRLVFLLGLKE